MAQNGTKANGLPEEKVFPRPLKDVEVRHTKVGCRFPPPLKMMLKCAAHIIVRYRVRTIQKHLKFSYIPSALLDTFIITCNRWRQGDVYTLAVI